MPTGTALAVLSRSRRKPGWNRSQFYGEFNTSKRSLALDLKHARAHEVVVALVGWADVILETVLTSWTEHWQLVLGPILLLVVLFTQGGLSGLFNRLGVGRSEP